MLKTSAFVTILLSCSLAAEGDEPQWKDTTPPPVDIVDIQVVKAEEESDAPAWKDPTPEPVIPADILDPKLEIIEIEKQAVAVPIIDTPKAAELKKERAPFYEDKTSKAHFGDLSERQHMLE